MPIFQGYTTRCWPHISGAPILQGRRWQRAAAAFQCCKSVFCSRSRSQLVSGKRRVARFSRRSACSCQGEAFIVGQLLLQVPFLLCKHGFFSYYANVLQMPEEQAFAVFRTFFSCLIQAKEIKHFSNCLHFYLPTSIHNLKSNSLENKSNTGRNVLLIIAF